MRTVYRYMLLAQEEAMRSREGATVMIRTPVGAKFVSAQLFNGDISVYAVVDTERNTELRVFRIIGTGQNAEILTFEDVYIGSIFVLNESYTYHIFDAGIFDTKEEQRHGHEQSARSDHSFVGRLQQGD